MYPGIINLSPVCPSSIARVHFSLPFVHPTAISSIDWDPPLLDNFIPRNFNVTDTNYRLNWKTLALPLKMTCISDQKFLGTVPLCTKVIDQKKSTCTWVNQLARLPPFAYSARTIPNPAPNKTDAQRAGPCRVINGLDISFPWVYFPLIFGPQMLRGKGPGPLHPLMSNNTGDEGKWWKWFLN